MIHETRRWDQRTCHLSLSITLMRFRVKNNGTSRQQGFGFDFDVDKAIMNKELYSLIQMFVAEYLVPACVLWHLIFIGDWWRDGL
jgi:hypothetical protein